MKIKLLAIILLTFLTFSDHVYSQSSSGNNVNGKANEGSSKVFNGFEPYDPVNFYYPFITSDAQGQVEMRDWRNMQQEDLDRVFCNEAVLVMVAEMQENGMYQFVPNGLSKKKHHYTVYTDYMKYTSVQLKNEKGEMVGNGRMGVGLRIRINLYTKVDGVVLTDIFSMTMAVKEGKANGSVSMEVLGLQSNDISRILPLPSEINEASVQNALNTMATIKSKVYESSTVLSPQLIAVKFSPQALEEEGLSTGSVSDPRKLIQEAVYKDK